MAMLSLQQSQSFEIMYQYIGIDGDDCSFPHQAGPEAAIRYSDDTGDDEMVRVKRQSNTTPEM
jgi:hypothetical protein